MWFIVPILAAGVGSAYLYNSVTEEEKQAEASWKGNAKKLNEL